MKLYYPLKGNYRITDSFGPRRSFQLPDGRWTLPFHYGVDFSAPQGTPVYASHSGTVTFAGWDSSGYGGGYQVQVTDGKWSTWYLHMVEQPLVRVGQRVSSETVLGRVGSTGASTGPHLHLELHENGVPVDPANYLTTEVYNPTPSLQKGKRLYISGWRSASRAGQNKNLTFTKWGKTVQKLTSGKRNFLWVNTKKHVSVVGAGNYQVTASVWMRGTPGDTFTLGAVRGTWNSKDGWKQSAFLESVQGVIGKNGVAKMQITIANTVPKNQRLRFYIHPAKSAKPITVERYSVKGTKF